VNVQQRRRRRRVDAAKGARVLLTVSDPDELDRLSGALRDAGLRVASLNRLDALVPLTRVFKPDLALVGVGGTPLEAARVGRQVSRRFGGAVPVLYLGDVGDAHARRALFEHGHCLQLLPRGPSAEELLSRIRAVLSFRAAVAEAERGALEERSPLLHDEVTDLYNRRFLLEQVALELRRCERHGGGFSVLIAELDDFLECRKEHGEDVCDRLMVYCATLLRQGLRDADVVARVGRYHFGVLLPGMPAEQLACLVERLERRLALARFDFGRQPARASMTFGAASFPDVMGPPQQIFASAIQSLDRARDNRSGGAPLAAI
jgi:two-component system cell cycle response regulator